jgi:hypothetical protein
MGDSSTNEFKLKAILLGWVDDDDDDELAVTPKKNEKPSASTFVGKVYTYSCSSYSAKLKLAFGF